MKVYSTVSTKRINVSHTAVVMTITNAVKIEKLASQQEQSAVHWKKKNAMTDVFQSQILAAHQNNQFVNTLTNASFTAVTSSKDSNGAKRLKNVKNTAALKIKSGVMDHMAALLLENHGVMQDLLGVKLPKNVVTTVALTTWVCIKSGV